MKVKTKTLKKMIGWLILIILFLALFAIAVADVGIVKAIIAFVVAFGSCGLVYLGVYLIHD
jgi:hypothetical protein